MNGDFFKNLSGSAWGLVVTIVVAAGTTILASYVSQAVNSEILANQVKLLENLEDRVSKIEQTRFSDKDADRELRVFDANLESIKTQLQLLREEVKDVKAQLRER